MNSPTPPCVYSSGAFLKKNDLGQMPLEQIVTVVGEKLRNALSDAARPAAKQPTNDT